MREDRIQVDCPSCRRRLSRSLSSVSRDRIEVRCPACAKEFRARRPVEPREALPPARPMAGKGWKLAVFLGVLLLVLTIVLAAVVRRRGVAVPDSSAPDKTVPAAVVTFQRMAVLPSGGGKAPPLAWALSALVVESLEAGEGARLVPLQRAALMDRDLGGEHNPLGLASLARALGAETLLLLEVSEGFPPSLGARLHWPASGESRSLPRRPLVFGHTSRTAAAVASEVAHLLGPGVSVAGSRIDLGSPQDRGSLEALGRALALRAGGELGKARDAAQEALRTAKTSSYLLGVLAGLELELGDRKAAARWAAAAWAQRGRVSSRARQRIRALELEATGRLEEAAEALAKLRREQPGALETTLWEVRLWVFAGRPDAARQALDEVVARLSGAAAEDPRLELARAATASLEGDGAGRLAAARRAVALAQMRGDRRQQSLALLDVGAALLAARELTAAREVTQEAGVLAQSLEAPFLRARCDNARGLVLGLGGQRQAAEEAFALSLEGCARLGLRAAEAAVLVNRGKIRQSLGDAGGARADLRRSAAVYEELGDEAGRREALRALANLDRDAGALDVAAEAR